MLTLYLRVQNKTIKAYQEKYTQRPTVKFFSVAFLDVLALNIFQILQSYIVYAQVFKNKQTHWSMNSVLTPNASAMYPKVRDR